MDDMTPTDKLRSLLDERGIEWWPDKYYKETNTVWRVGNFEWCASEQKDGRLLIGCTCIETMTPEQAIAATVGNGTNLSKRLREVHGLHAFAELFGFDWHDESDWSWHDVACAMADAIDATMGVGTCHVKAVKKLGDSFGFLLSCGHSMVNPFDDRPDYCPWCGRRVIDYDEEDE